MSIKLSKGEKIVKSYDYATAGRMGVANSAHSQKALIVTNKRIIHSEVAQGMGLDQASTQEMPISSVKYVDTYYAMKSFALWLVLGILFVVFAIGALITSFALSEDGGSIVPTIILAGIAVAFFLLYKFKKEYVVSCTLKGDGRVNPIIGFSGKNGNTLTRKHMARVSRKSNAMTINVQVKVNKIIAKELVEELGALIQDAASGVYDEVAAAPAQPE